MSIQQMPYPPHIEENVNDIGFRVAISNNGIIAFLIPLCIESTYASKEKFIGVNVSMLLYNFFFFFMYFRDYCKILLTCLLFTGFNGDEWRDSDLQFIKLVNYRNNMQQYLHSANNHTI